MAGAHFLNDRGDAKQMDDQTAVLHTQNKILGEHAGKLDRMIQLLEKLCAHFETSIERKPVDPSYLEAAKAAKADPPKPSTPLPPVPAAQKKWDPPPAQEGKLVPGFPADGFFDIPSKSASASAGAEAPEADHTRRDV